ncbi:YciI family protein [Shewanella sp. CG12_big_fil_rev_8_21_14_0_65_47_15]|uniref:YciI family protein n=1 Tax=Shewanella sp. CG12_big_fil_rev_8_21_14_0_65_47_15 TaxID=1975537 RepID=UPI000CB986FA|nr:YciI family protein [Shewanella sp. CG12_big_fil_rev_8_21_14_0_65_47_15]PIW62665.1 MAG: dehydrogenase [Shewanella sp. CG12_big_fil_rev_8_21_14_0_65_47_15]
MKYLALVYFQEAAMQQLSQQQWDELNRECIACGERLQLAGHYLGGNPLESVDTATTVRVRDGKLLTTDGPFAETKEQLAGYYLLEAKDLNEAVTLVAKIPPARYGCVEVRPVRELQAENNGGPRQAG